MDGADELLSQSHRKFCVEKFSGSENKIVSRRQSMVVDDKKKSDRQSEIIRQSAVLVPLCKIGNSVGLLYTKRSSALRAHAGQVSFPGGKCDSEETAVQTAIRETCEELGVSEDVIDVWTAMPTVPGKDGKDMITPIVAQLSIPDKTVLNPNRQEVEDVFIKRIGDLHNASTCGYTQFRVKGNKNGGYTLPVYNTEPYKIWGLTAIITFQFLNVFLRKQPISSSKLHFRHKLNFQTLIKI